MYVIREEQYQDLMARLYPELGSSDGHNTMNITFQVTDACSLACTYCYQINKGKKVMQLQTAKDFIDNLFEGKYTGYVSEKEKPFLILEFIGGEPFLQPKLIEDICDYFYNQAIERMSAWAEHSVISISTNGVHWFEPEVQHFLNKYNRKLSISITIDGNKELHDSCRRFPDGRPSYDLVVAAAKDWMEHGHELGSKITIAPENLPYMNDAIIHFLSLGYKIIHANTVYEKGWTAAHAHMYYEKLKEIADYFIDNNLCENTYLALFEQDIGQPKKETDLQPWCGGNGNNMLAIDPDGNLFPCLRYMGSSLGTDREPLIIGTVWDGIGKTPKQAQWIKCMACITRRTECTDECFYCPIVTGCGECSAYNYQMTGTPDCKVTYMCIMHKARTLANTYYWNKWYRKQNSKERLKVNCPKDWALEIISEEEYNALIDLSKDE